MIDLPNITLIGVDNIHPHLLFKARDFSTRHINFGAEVMITDVPIKSKEDYSEFCIKELPKHFDTEFCLMIQADGFVINHNKWDPTWLNYDYIGCPWFWLNQPCVGAPKHNWGKVGNGGFSLRSKKLCTFLSENHQMLPYGKIHPEDAFIGHCNGHELTKLGCKFPTVEVAREFSHGESGSSYRDTFGFHGSSHVKRITQWLTENK